MQNQIVAADKAASELSRDVVTPSSYINFFHTFSPHIFVLAKSLHKGKV